MNETPIFFVGNSPNQLSVGDSSWAGLMRDLRAHAGVAAEGHGEKPFTLHFEELLCSFRKKARADDPDAEPRTIDKKFKTVIADKMQRLQPNEVHKQLMRLPVTNILTTNYDYCLEQALQPGGDPELRDWKTDEKRYCLFRRRSAGENKFVFHIHGEIARPESIMLGHEAYVESCSNIRRFTDMQVRGESGKMEDGKGKYYRGAGGWLKGKYRNGTGQIDPNEPHSWVDLFMLRDVHIVGFGLEFTEVDIWYLISYKARLMLHPEVPADLKSSHIVFHYFADHETKHLAKVSLLRSLGVKCRPHPITLVDDEQKDYRGAWKNLLEELSKALSPRAQNSEP